MCPAFLEVLFPKWHGLLVLGLILGSFHSIGHSQCRLSLLVL